MFSRLNFCFKLVTVCFLFTHCYRAVSSQSHTAFRALTERRIGDVRSFNANVSRSRRSVFHLKYNASDKIIFQSKEKPAVNKSQPLQRPRFYLPQKTFLPLDPKAYICDEYTHFECANRTSTYRDRILGEFQKSAKIVVNEPNLYNVDYKRKFLSRWDFRETLMLSRDRSEVASCMVLKAKVHVLRKRDPLLNGVPLGKTFPKKKIFKAFREIKSCAIVSSAGSMKGSRLGRFIDLHDIVLRFNNAPVEGFEEDVGTKTTIRVVNSQVVSKVEFHFVDSPIFQNITIAAWDPGRYNITVKDWLENADFNLFANYEKFRKRYPKSNAYLIDPQSIWKLWDQLQGFTRTPIRCNPPSSGFIGLALILPHCPYVDFIEYVPSTRLNGMCHYYSDEINSACTFGAWHPLAAEKLMTLQMNVADDYATFQNGIIRIRRPKSASCS